MPGLSFLAKKSWHTTNVKNVEQVWIAEQKDAAEKKKIAEFEKQIKEERQIQELRALQAASGNAVKMVDNSLDWMYEGPSGAAVQKESSEEYLLGKIFKGNDPNTINMDSSAASGSVNNPKWVRKVNAKNDAFTRVHEDPFLFIKQQEKLKRDAVLNNPLKMEKVRTLIASELEKNKQIKLSKKDEKKRRKEEKKRDKKSKKKSEKVKEASYSRDCSSDEDKGDRVKVQNLYERTLTSAEVKEDECVRSGSDRAHLSKRARREEVLADSSSSSSSHTPTVVQYSSGIDEHRGRSGHGHVQIKSSQNSRIENHVRDQYDDRVCLSRSSGSPSELGVKSSRDSDFIVERSRSGTVDDHKWRSFRRDDSRERDISGHGEYCSDRDKDWDRDRYPRDRDRDVDKDPRGRDRDRDRGRNYSTDRFYRDRDRGKDSSRNVARQESGYSQMDRFQPKETRAVVEKDSERNQPSKLDGDDASTQKIKGYGLESRSDSSSMVNRGYIGPNPNLINIKVEKEKAEREAKLNRKPAMNVKALTEEEKAARLAAMQEDAMANETARIRRLAMSAGDVSPKTDAKKNESSSGGSMEDVNFLTEMRSEVYNTVHATSLEDRLQQNKHYTQRPAVLNSEGFTKQY